MAPDSGERYPITPLFAEAREHDGRGSRDPELNTVVPQGS
jgi:hypothetical protein